MCRSQAKKNLANALVCHAFCSALVSLEITCSVQSYSFSGRFPHDDSLVELLPFPSIEDVERLPFLGSLRHLAILNKTNAMIVLPKAFEFSKFRSSLNTSADLHFGCFAMEWNGSMLPPTAQLRRLCLAPSQLHQINYDHMLRVFAAEALVLLGACATNLEELACDVLLIWLDCIPSDYLPCLNKVKTLMLTSFEVADSVDEMSLSWRKINVLTPNCQNLYIHHSSETDKIQDLMVSLTATPLSTLQTLHVYT